MSVVAATEERTVPARAARRTTPAAALAALGIVYGDLGRARSTPCKRSPKPSVDGLPLRPPSASSR